MVIKQKIYPAIPMAESHIAAGVTQFVSLINYAFPWISLFCFLAEVAPIQAGAPRAHQFAQGAGAALIPYLNGTTSADEEPTYCCNSVVISGNDTLVCSKVGSTDPSPFPIANGSVIVDVAGLNGLVRQSSSTGSSTIANNTGNDNTSKKLNSSDGSQKEVAIGAGVGVPLGVIALLSIVWALYERRLRKKIPQPAPAPAGYYGYASRPSASPLELAELTASEPKPAELDNSTMKTYR
ncbi:uncharacterized protein N7498_006101 [Penicillium cinerascens]|uniref:Mid2 domain-containing protein n=1 Tax=Penicillium cinerascens TaxID=70096 RepID=A0A9W9SWU1_9EURO|nr:uncharacterized protein N7498_006101 [Penicillium cinerascens]KAJ5201438.1 hypothetical protein N7498_006101 [Penicillium cinerascens]